MCGGESSSNPGPTVLAHADAGDERLSSLRSAVQFSKANNLLGVIVDGDILVNVHLAASLPLPLANHVSSYFPVSVPTSLGYRFIHLSKNEQCETEKSGPDRQLGRVGSGGVALFVYGGDFVYFR